MKVLVIQQKMIGDVLTSSILFEVLREKYPNATLDYLINSHTYPVVENNPYINDFVFFTKEAEQSKKALLALAKDIKQKNYDIIIDIYSKISSNILTLFAGAKTKISYYKPYSTFVYTHNIKRHKATSSKSGLAIVNRLQLLEPLDIHLDIAKPKIYLTQKEISDSETFLQQHGIDKNKPLFMISVLGSSPNKTYPFEYMAKVIDTIVTQTKGQILFNYIPKQENEARAIFNACLPETQRHIYFEVFGKSLRDFIAITHHCDALIGNEGGAVNMAKALNTPTFTIFSPWIDTQTWSVFEDNRNVAVHLKHFEAQLFDNKPTKALKKEVNSLYNTFKPDYFEAALKDFLNHITSL